MQRRLNLLLVRALLVMIAGLSATTRAATVHYDYTGHVTSSGSPALSGEFSVGSAVSGWFDLDTSVSDSNSAFPQSGFYAGALTQGSVVFGSRTVSTSGNDVGIGNNNSADIISLTAGPAFGAGGTISMDAPVSGWTLIGWNWQLMDSSGNAFSSDGIPDSTAFTSLGLYDTHRVLLILRENTSGSAAFVEASLDQITSPVPEPISTALLGLGLAGLVAARRRKSGAA